MYCRCAVQIQIHFDIDIDIWNQDPAISHDQDRDRDRDIETTSLLKKIVVVAAASAVLNSFCNGVSCYNGIMSAWYNGSYVGSIWAVFQLINPNHSFQRSAIEKAVTFPYKTTAFTGKLAVRTTLL